MSRGLGPVSAALLMGLLAGCGSPNAVPLPAYPTVSAASSDLADAREAAGIPDCPETDLDAEAVPGGLPALVLGCLASDSQINLAGLRGMPTVVNVWAQWCGPCRVEGPSLGRFAAAVRDEVQVIGINYDDPDAEAALVFAAAVGWTYPQVADPYRQIASPLQVGGIPVTLFVNADGVIVHRVAGAVDDEMLASLTQEYLGVTV